MAYDENAPARLKYDIHSYEDARNALARSRFGKIGNNTTVVGLDDGAIGIQLHNTIIVTYYPDGTVRLNSGGYRTTTTKGRMNSVLPPGYHVYQEKREWWVNARQFLGPTEFFDGMNIAPDGTVWDSKTGSGRDVGTRLSRIGGASTRNPRRNPSRPRRNPRHGKFDSGLDELMYHLSLEGADDEHSFADEWWGRLDSVSFEDVVRAAEETGEDEHSARKYWNEEPKLRGKDFIPVVIIHEDHNGITTVRYFLSDREAEKLWNKVFDEAIEHQQGD